MTDNMNRTRAGLVNLTSNVQRSLVIFESTSQHSGLEGGAIKDAFKEVNGEALGKNFFSQSCHDSDFFIFFVILELW